MATRYGAVIVLKPGLTEAEANACLEQIRAMSDVEIEDFTVGTEFIKCPKMHEYDDRHGGPVFYLP